MKKIWLKNSANFFNGQLYLYVFDFKLFGSYAVIYRVLQER